MTKNLMNMNLSKINYKQGALLIGVVFVVGLVAGLIGAGISNSANISLSPSNTTDVNTYPDMVSYPGSLFMGYGKMFGFLTSTNNYRTMLQLVNTPNGPNTLRIGNNNIWDGTDAVSIYVEGKPNALVVDKNGNVNVNGNLTANNLYTKEEVDAKFTTNQKVFSILNQCQPTFHILRVVNNFSADPRDTDDFPDEGGCSSVCENPDKYPNTFKSGTEPMIAIGAIANVQERGSNYPIFSYFVPQNISKRGIAGLGYRYGTQNDVLAQCICCKV